MSRHCRHHSRRKFRGSMGLYLGIAGLFAAAAFVTFAAFSSAPSSLEFSAHSIWQQALKAGKSALRKNTARSSQRLVLPYSIIAGGVRSPQELRKAIEEDPVTGAQYANFDLAKTKLVKLQHDEYAYVSFRVGDDVYWTSHKVKLCKGETVITDGKRYGRARCGNRVSKTARLPFYRQEPSAETLNTPVKPTIETEAFSSVAPRGLAFLKGLPASPSLSMVPTGVPEMAPTSPAMLTSIGYDPFLAPPPCAPSAKCTKTKQPPTTCPSQKAFSRFDLARAAQTDCGTPTPPPPSPTPESSEWVLVATGLAALGLVRALKERTTHTNG